MTVPGIQGIQQFAIPQSGTYSLRVAGARGGDRPGYSSQAGAGASLTVSKAFTAGDTISVIVGQQGVASVVGGYNYGGGGGGSYIFDSAGNLLAVAGGGGGPSTTFSPFQDNVNPSGQPAGITLDGAGTAGKLNNMH